MSMIGMFPGGGVSSLKYATGFFTLPKANTVINGLIFSPKIIWVMCTGPQTVPTAFYQPSGIPARRR